jgi:citrate lyase beta subunit
MLFDDIRKTLFFVPATKLKKLKTLLAENNLEVIIDFEDAIAGVEIQPLLELKPQDVNWNKIWCRIPLIMKLSYRLF